VQQAIFWAGTVLELVLLWRLVRWRAWRYYPWFFFFFACLFLRLLFIQYARNAGYEGDPAYAFWYWTSSVVTTMLWFPVAWEIFRSLFGQYPALSRIAGLLVIGALVSLAGFYSLSEAPGFLRLPDIQRKVALAVAVWIVAAYLLSRYYQVAPNRNVWGIALGLGLLAATSVINFAAIGLNESYFPALRYVQPATFTLALILWTWTLWVHTPNPALPDGPPPENYITQGTSFWSKIRETLRRALGL
jgi:hypothetical protein